MKLILASASPRRKDLLQGITGDFLTVRVDADELAVGVWPEREEGRGA